jgi:hypothetical protein
VGQDYKETYSLVAQWPVIRLLFVQALINNGVTKQLDFVQAFPQTPISCKQFAELPKGIKIQGLDPRDYVFEVLRNIYSGKDAKPSVGGSCVGPKAPPLIRHNKHQVVIKF